MPRVSELGQAVQQAIMKDMAVLIAQSGQVCLCVSVRAVECLMHANKGGTCGVGMRAERRAEGEGKGEGEGETTEIATDRSCATCQM